MSKPTATTPAAIAALRIVVNTPAGLTTKQLAQQVGCTLNHMELCLCALRHAALIGPVCDGKRNVLWLTPKRVEPYKTAQREAQRIRKLDEDRRRRAAKRRVRVAKPKDEQISFQGMSDEEIDAVIRRRVAANDAKPLRTNAVRWVFDLGRAA